MVVYDNINAQTLNDRVYLTSLVRKFAATGALQEAVNRRGEKMHCTRCGILRRMELEILHEPPGAHCGLPDEVVSAKGELLRYPWVFNLRCVVCETEHLAVLTRQTTEPLAERPGGYARTVAVVIPEQFAWGHGRVPRPVLLYMEQAERCRLIGANSAAVAMYRAALEQLLYERGFTGGMLNRKIRDLEAAMASASPPSWIAASRIPLLNACKELGNAAIHPNDGNIAIQTRFGGEFMNDLAYTMAELIRHVYPDPNSPEARAERRVIEDAANLRT